MKHTMSIYKISLNESQFNSLKFLVGINYPVDTITLEIGRCTNILREFFGDELDEIKTDYVMCTK